MWQDLTCAPCIGRWNLNHWTLRKVQLPLSHLTSLSALLQCPWKCRPAHQEGVVVNPLTCGHSRFSPFLALVLFCFADHRHAYVSSCICGVCLEVGWLGAEKSHRQPCSRRRWFSRVDEPKGSSGFFQIRRGFNPRSPYCEPRLSLKLKLHKDNGAEFWSL